MGGAELGGFSLRNKQAQKAKDRKEAEKAADLQRKWDHEDWVAWHYRDSRAESASKKRKSQQ